MNANKIIICLAVCAVVLAHNAFAACIGSVPVWGTGDDRSSCARKQILKKEEQRLSIEQKERELAIQRQGLHNNQGTGSGSGNTNVILGGLSDIVNGKNENERVDPILVSQHQVRVEVMPYVIPGAYQFDKPGMPEKFFINGAAWEYYVNRNLGFGLLWQEWSKTGSQSFDPIMAGQRDGSGDAPIFFPGAINRIAYRSIIPYVSINAQLGSPLWMAVFRVGLGRTEAKLEYKDIDKALHPLASQPEDETYVDNMSIMGDLAMERWTQSGTRMGFALRYINARHETSNYLEYVNMSSAQLVFYVQFMLKPLGLL